MDVVKIADGVPALIGMTIYVLDGIRIVEREIIAIEGNMLMYKDPSYSGCRAEYVYSTKLAAELGYRKDGLL